ncbi:hypothetical protein MGYG_00178 [Nannizzia gypsea CBS 118893]|uniref:Ribosomal protein mS38 C-terminal domain-containing protein n=1 Tax=Arthroderma gypseum (strain ATCC MYA-4604 / CBS 118893) TaxID=535722 RepID=E5R3L1_ARTGP|nr:hypothetical protein MGYG_00178 [Nannizzia gypsea CBS 118893]EFQ97135.1 hypothetical protein MGYG_00178 [Nannizzia gypsea CBS 118893]
MISSSVRRAALPSTAALPSRAVLLAVSSSSPAPGPSSGNPPYRHQRRYSSSKPPVPPSDGSRGIDPPAQTPAKSVSSGPSSKKDVEKREGRSSRKRAGKDGETAKSKQASSLKLPSVPSTQHLHPHDVHVASFFSIHRPMSITTSVPPNNDSKTFSAIFSPKKQAAARQKDVIYTLSSAVNAIEQNLPGQHQASAEDIEFRNAISQASSIHAESDVTHLDGVPTQELRASIQEFAKRLRPFNPPPAPTPMDGAFESAAGMESAADKSGAAEAAAESEPSDQTFSTVLTIRESRNAEGRKSYEAYASPFVRVDDMEAPSAQGESSIYQDQETSDRSVSEPKQSFLQRMVIRQLQWERAQGQRQRERMYTISVKRQRKLKMKKHKHKKLLKKTRTLRRKLDKN